MTSSFILFVVHLFVMMTCTDGWIVIIRLCCFSQQINNYPVALLSCLQSWISKFIIREIGVVLILYTITIRAQTGLDLPEKAKQFSLFFAHSLITIVRMKLKLKANA